MRVYQQITIAKFLLSQATVSMTCEITQILTVHK